MKFLISVLLLTHSTFLIANDEINYPINDRPKLNLTLEKNSCGDNGPWTVMSVMSRHHKTNKPYNEENFGLGLECDYSNNWKHVVGWYENSFKKTSVYFGAIWSPDWAQTKDPFFDGDVKAGIIGAAITGYSKSSPIPLVAGMVMWEKHNIGKQKHSIGVNYMWVPPYENEALSALQVKANFNTDKWF